MKSPSSFLFSKYSGCGNDFVMVDNRENTFPSQKKEFIAQVCHRAQGIGADGLILLEHSSKASFKMRYFNADGSEAEMCGNGIRCFGKFLLELGFPKQNTNIELGNRCISLSYKENLICVDMCTPNDFRWDLTIPTKSHVFQGHYLDTGVPHVVVFVPDLDSIDVFQIGKEIRHHSLFAPKGTNVNFVSFQNPRLLEIRTFERGVEAETLACGSGATAAALAVAHTQGLEGPFQVKTRSQEIIEINFAKKKDAIHNLQMTGPARQVFKGIYLAEEVLMENPVENCLAYSVK
jgi:diaminopimelate epimerase